MGLSIIIAIVAFLIVTLILVALLLYAKAKLMPSGEVKIDINDGQKELTVSPGGSLLSTLGNNGIFLPSVAEAVLVVCANVKFWRAAVKFCLLKSTSLRVVNKPKSGVWDAKSR